MSLLRCFSTLGCPSASIDDVDAIARRFGIPRVEFRALGDTLDLADYFAATFNTPADFAHRLASSPIKVVALDTSARLIGGAPNDEATLLRLAPWADAAGIPWLRVFDGGTIGTQNEIEQAIDGGRRWQAALRQGGCKADILVETHDALTRSSAIRRFCAGTNAALLWDAHHTWKRGGEDPVTTWRTIGWHVKHIHVKDSAPATSAAGWGYVLPGTGQFPMKPLLATVTAAAFRGAVSLEWERRWAPELPPLEDALASAEATNWW